MYPHFLGIGAQKAGTTWLHAMLRQHDELWLPPVKELHYFDRRYPLIELPMRPDTKSRRSRLEKFIRTRLRRVNPAKVRDLFQVARLGEIGCELRYLLGRGDDHWYSSLFKRGRGRVVGEITPAYACLSSEAILHVYRLMPEAKLILLLRDPIDRAWSHARMDLRRNAERGATQAQDEHYRRHFESAQSRMRGDYVTTLERWLSRYPPSQLFVGFYDEIVAEPVALLKRIFRFLGVADDEHQIPNDARSRVNPGTGARIPPDLHLHLCSLYIDQLRILAQRFDTYPRFWLEKCETILRAQISDYSEATC
jgi:hypothetical protein